MKIIQLSTGKEVKVAESSEPIDTTEWVDFPGGRVRVILLLKHTPIWSV